MYKTTLEGDISKHKQGSLKELESFEVESGFMK